MCCIINLAGQKLVSAEMCNLQLGCTESDFDCWLACKKQYHGFGGCSNKDFILSQSAFLAGDDDGGDGGDEGDCCHCQCKFNSAGPCPNPNSADPPAANPPEQIMRLF